MNSNKRLGNKLFKKFFGGSGNDVADVSDDVSDAVDVEQNELARLEAEVEINPSDDGKVAVNNQRELVHELVTAETSFKKVEAMKEVSNKQDDTNIFKDFFKNLIYIDDDKPCPLIIILLIIFGIIYLLTPTLFPNYFKNIGFFDIIFNILNIVGAIIICGFVSREGLCDVDSAFTFKFLAHIIVILYPILLLLLHISTVNKKKKKNENINTMTNFANTNNLETSDEALIDNLENNNLDSDELENTENTNL